MDFYYTATSAPCRSVLMVCKALGIKVNKKLLNLRAGEHLTPEFLKLNPQHQVPTLVDNDFVIWESHAIVTYLVEKYAKDDSLYPKCPQQRAKVNQRLYFDMGTLYQSYAQYFYPQFRQKQPADPEKLKQLENALQLLNTFLQNDSFVAGPKLTVADITILATVSTFEAVGIDFEKFENVVKWYKQCKTTVAGFDENWEGCQLLAAAVKAAK